VRFFPRDFNLALLPLARPYAFVRAGQRGALGEGAAQGRYVCVYKVKPSPTCLHAHALLTYLPACACAPGTLSLLRSRPAAPRLASPCPGSVVNRLLFHFFGCFPMFSTFCHDCLLGGALRCVRVRVRVRVRACVPACLPVHLYVGGCV
jgi:hypothetical protein